jgi:GR25 family glycosyltransferase involved in LPS biosynthesis
MVIFDVLLQSEARPHAPKFDFVDLPGVEVMQVDRNNYERVNGNEIKVDWDYILSKFHFQITHAEISCFLIHRYVWHLFLNCPHEWCIIIEDSAVCDSRFSFIRDMIKGLPPDWDVFYPFDKSSITNNPGEIRRLSFEYGPYLLGYYWGSYAYMLSKSGANKLLGIREIRQPVDEEILQMSIDGKLSMHISQSTFFHARDHSYSGIKAERDSAMKKVVQTMNVWSLEAKDRVRTILGLMSGYAVDSYCDLVLDSGTLLGYVRHGKILPWDDGVDLALDRLQFSRFVGKVDEYRSLRWRRIFWPKNASFYYKFWLEDGEKVGSHDYTFPSVDVWLYKGGRELIIFEEGKILKSSVFNPLKPIRFEGWEFKIPTDPLKCLDGQYYNWRERIQIYPWSHRLEKKAFPPLSIPIRTDANGRLIDDI